MDLITFIKEATTLNVHAFWHWAGGMFLYSIFTVAPLLWRFPYRAVMLFAILFEIVMYSLYGYTGYSGGLIGYIADTLGDILIAGIAALTVLIAMKRRN